MRELSVCLAEPKSAKNRIHWDVTASDVLPLVEAGSTVLREPDQEIDWHVLADPEGTSSASSRLELAGVWSTGC